MATPNVSISLWPGQLLPPMLLPQQRNLPNHQFPIDASAAEVVASATEPECCCMSRPFDISTTCLPQQKLISLLKSFTRASGESCAKVKGSWRDRFISFEGGDDHETSSHKIGMKLIFIGVFLLPYMSAAEHVEQMYLPK